MTDPASPKAYLPDPFQVSDSQRIRLIIFTDLLETLEVYSELLGSHWPLPTLVRYHAIQQ